MHIGRTSALLAISTLIGSIGVTTVQAAQVDITNGNGSTPNQFMSSNGGLSSDNFFGTEANGVSVWLRARNKGDQGPVSRNGNVFTIREDSGAEADRFAFEFQFSPMNGDVFGTDQYQLSLELDSDPSSAVSFTPDNTFAASIFDNDGGDANDLTRYDSSTFPGSFPGSPDDSGEDDELSNSQRTMGNVQTRSWDDGDSLAVDGFTNRTSGVVNFNNPTGSRSGTLPNFVIANSWLADWDFTGFSTLGDDFNGAPPAGLYDIRLTAFDAAGDELASTEITANVGDVPSPGTTVLFVTGLLGLGLVARRSRSVNN